MKINIIGYALIILLIYICLKIYQESDAFNLKCIISDVDGKKYCVRERSKLTLAAERLATVNQKLGKLVNHCKKEFPERENVTRLVEGYNPKKISETLPTSEFTAFSENKGEKLAFCLNRKKNDNDDLIDERTLTFVSIHELAHVGTKSIGHKTEFWENFKFLLENAKESGIHDPEDYKENPKEYCGMKINDNPYYDLV